MRQPMVLASLLLAACGGGGSGRTTEATVSESSGGECRAREELAAAESELGQCHAAHEADAGWPARGQYDGTVAQLSAHLASLDPPRALTSDDVQPLAEAIWELLDQVEFPTGGEAARGRAETAAERLLRERDLRAAPAAAIEALDAVTQIVTVADPSGGVDPCAAEELRVGESRIAEAMCASAGR